MAGREIMTPRLVLRPHGLADAAESAAMWADAAVTRFIGGRAFDAEESRARLLRYAGHWALHGWGFWVVRDRADGAFLGEVGFGNYCRAIAPAFGEAPEIGWALVPAAQGRGVGREAVAAALGWGDARFARTVCMIRPGNARSMRLAEGLGYRRYAVAEYHGAETVLLERERPEGGR
jgi:RimJ/RimL family protein N-acetyltransferase